MLDIPFFLLSNNKTIQEMVQALAKLPTYNELPIDNKYPPKTAWGLWGEEDNYGTLNLLTEERVANVRISR
jgi:hypothetical protein